MHIGKENTERPPFISNGTMDDFPRSAFLHFPNFLKFAMNLSCAPEVANAPAEVPLPRQAEMSESCSGCHTSASVYFGLCSHSLYIAVFN